MIEERTRYRAGIDARSRRPAATDRRPDRVALWAVFLGLFAVLGAAASAQAGDAGGVGTGGQCEGAPFGERTLRLGDCGRDVKVLNWILKSKRYEDRVPLDGEFVNPTDDTVRAFERRAGIRVDGVVERRTRRKLVRSMNSSMATWYGPGFFGNRTACGVRLRKRTVGVAHRRLPCGTKVTFKHGGRYLRTKVIDRGPYADGIKWDLTRRAARRLNFEFTDSVRAAVIR